MENAKDDAARVRLMLIEYANELANETPVLRRFTDCIPAPDGLGGCEEMEADRAYREAVRHPKDGLTLAACVDCLNALRDVQTSFNALRGRLRLKDFSSIADELSERRSRRATDIDRMIEGARTILDDAGLHDYRKWEAAAQTFNDGIATDIEYIHTAIDEIKAATNVTNSTDEIITTIHQEADAIRQDFADVGDTMCEIVGKDRIPPEPKKVDQTSRRELYKLLKRIKEKQHVRRKDLETFLNKTTWTFKGFNAREIYKDVDGLNRFYNAERNWMAHHPGEN